MLMVLSPAKTLDYERSLPPALAQLSSSTPLLLDESVRLISVLQALTTTQIAALMGLSQPLAELNFQRFQDWQADHRLEADGPLRPAILAFNGDVYTNLAASSLSADDILWAQQHLRILSGLYGCLRPLDRMRAYRLEMGTQLATTRGKNLYDFWDRHIRDQLVEALDKDTDDAVLINLASQEYFRAVAADALGYPVVQCVFEDWTAKQGYHVIGLEAKKARGLMARHIIQHRIRRVSDLRQFAAAGYAYADDGAFAKKTGAKYPINSYPERMVFRRKPA